MKFAKYGLAELKLYGTISGLLTLSVFILTYFLLSLRIDRVMLLTLPFAFIFSVIVWFFRDPDRPTPRGDNRLLSPADGIVFDIAQIEFDEFIGGPATRIGIFLSIFDVHVNRVPCSGTVEQITYKRGTFVSAMKANECSARNESNFIGIDNAGGTGIRIGMKQIAGQIARRIVCQLREGDQLVRGARFGMIKFGSRAELFVPASSAVKIKCKLGMHVKGGETVLVVIEQETQPTESHELEMAELPETQSIEEGTIGPSEDITEQLEPVTSVDEPANDSEQVTESQSAPTTEDAPSADSEERQCN